MALCAQCDAEYPGDLAECPNCAQAGEVFTCERCNERFQGSDSCPACGLARVEFPCDEHPEAVAEGRCVICGKAACKECRRGEGIATLCEEHSGVTVIQGWAQIYSTTREFEAQLLRENLTSEGLEARTFSQKDNMLSVDLGELSIVRLLVPAWEYERAVEVMRTHMDEAGEVTFACPSCGEAYEPGTESCTECGESLVPVS